MRLLLRSLGLSLLFSLAVASLVLIVAFGHHYRLLNIKGNAVLFSPSGQKLMVALGLGKVLQALRRPAVLVFTILIPSILVITGEVRHLWRSYARQGYSARLES